MSLFHFKEFVIDQENCPMKINTDGVLLGATADVEKADDILDIGTGTGVIALMLAQRNTSAKIDGVDIDHIAFEKASLNFKNSLFHERLKAHHHHFLEYFEMHPLKRYDLIVSNPPYFLNSLQSPKRENNLSKHTDEKFFLDLLHVAKNHLSDLGRLELVVPVEVSLMLQNVAPDFNIFPVKCLKIKSYPDKATIRHVISLGKVPAISVEFKEFCIYEEQGVHSWQYKAVLKNFFNIF